MTIELLKAIAEQKGYTIFENDSKDYNLNIWGKRNNTSSNKFDDQMFVFWKHAGTWILKEYKITTDPGRYYLKNPIPGTKGTGALVEGQHLGAWAIDKHKGQYDALCQVKPLPAYRDNNRDAILQLDPQSIQKGYWGCDIHRALKKGETYTVDNWSAMCQVFAKDAEFDEFMDLCYHARDTWGNKFSYTLI